MSLIEKRSKGTDLQIFVQKGQALPHEGVTQVDLSLGGLGVRKKPTGMQPGSLLYGFSVAGVKRRSKALAKCHWNPDIVPAYGAF
jgi:hypothetical protein